MQLPTTRATPFIPHAGALYTCPSARTQTGHKLVRRRAGRRNHHAGLAAEERTVLHYRCAGLRVLGQRIRTPHGELDLVVTNDTEIVFVEVKKTSRNNLSHSPVSNRQWQRLAESAEYYITQMSGDTGVQPRCRFDVAVMGPDGKLNVIENARSFDSY